MDIKQLCHKLDRLLGSRDLHSEGLDTCRSKHTKRNSTQKR